MAYYRVDSVYPDGKVCKNPFGIKFNSIYEADGMAWRYSISNQMPVTCLIVKVANDGREQVMSKYTKGRAG